MRDNHDPIEAAKVALMARGISEDQIKEIDKAIRSLVSDAADFAENAPEPAPSELYTEVLVEAY
jgi:pyruvate dehydrogenase E1 component alpha subunit